MGLMALLKTNGEDLAVAKKEAMGTRSKATISIHDKRNQGVKGVNQPLQELFFRTEVGGGGDN